MSFLGGMKDKMKRIKGAEWAMLLMVLGLFGSLLLSPGTSLLGGGGTPAPTDGGRDALEERLARVLSSMEGAGQVEVVIHYSVPARQVSGWLDGTSQVETQGEPIGVVVVAEGAGNVQVRLELARAVQTLLRLDADAVEVFKLGGETDGSEG